MYLTGYTGAMLISLLFGAFGAIIGSHVGVIAERMNTGQSFVSGRSRCNSCARPLSPHDLVPVLSFVFAKGKCRTCKAYIPGSYAILELTLGILFMLAYQKLGISAPLFIFFGVLAVLAVIVVYDLRHTIVPPKLSILLGVLSVLFVLLTVPNLHELGAVLFTAGAIGAGFLALHVFSGGRAMGLGDAPVALSLSLISASHALSGLLFSFWIGALYGIVVLVFRQGGPKMGIEVPFVPFLALGFLLAYFTGWNPLFSSLAF